MVWLDQALQVFPRSAEALLLRGHAQWAVGRYAQAEADFLAAAEIARFRESAYRCLSRLGELRYRRALEFWGNGDTESTCRLLAAALDAYDESNKRSRLNREGQAGRRLVAEMIDLLKRTKEWKEP